MFLYKAQILLKFKALYKAYTSKSSLTIGVGGILLLKHLSAEEVITIEEIKLFLRISNTKLKKIISQLEGNKFIEITKDSTDGRRKLVSISKKGKDYLNKEFEYYSWLIEYFSSIYTNNLGTSSNNITAINVNPL